MIGLLLIWLSKIFELQNKKLLRYIINWNLFQSVGFKVNHKHIICKQIFVVLKL